MKNLKIIIAVAGVTLAAINPFKASAKGNLTEGEVTCTPSSNICGVAHGGCVIYGDSKSI